MRSTLTIGLLANAAGVNVETIRYYQRRGLFGEPEKPLGGQRRYPDSAIADIAFIRRAQQLGFTLAEVKELLRLAKTKDVHEIRKMAEKRYASLTLHVKTLNKMRRDLKSLIAQARKAKGSAVSPILSSLKVG